MLAKLKLAINELEQLQTDIEAIQHVRRYLHTALLLLKDIEKEMERGGKARGEI